MAQCLGAVLGAHGHHGDAAAGEGDLGGGKEVKDAITVTELIEQENVETPQYVTVSVNDDFIDKAEFDTYALKEGDSVEFLYFMGGGR